MKFAKLSLPFIAILAMAGCQTAPSTSEATPAEPEKVIVEPGEQAPLANPGQKNFGGSHNPTDTAAANAARRARMAEMNTIRTIHFNDLSMSDPYIYADETTKTYYLTSSGGRMYKSKDLVMWEGPYNIVNLEGTWMERAGFAAAAEIHKIGDYYYYAGTWSDHSDLIQQVPRRYNVPHNQTVLLRSANIEGPYEVFDENPDHNYQPRQDDCIDGTLYQENGKIYMVYVHEWTQLIDGTMEYVELSSDLKKTISKPVCMFRASENPSCGEMNGLGEATFGLKMPGWVTDGPEMFRTKTGKLGMLWATWGKERYLQAVCYSESGTIAGPWVQEPEPFLANNSGHGMLFTTFEGELRYLVHHSEGNGPRKPQMWTVDLSGDKLVLGKQIVVK